MIRRRIINAFHDVVLCIHFTTLYYKYISRRRIINTFEATTFYRRLASLLASRWGDDYSVVMGWLHCSLSFSLLRSAIECVRGARSSIGHFHRAPPTLDLVQVESNIITNFNDH